MVDVSSFSFCCQYVIIRLLIQLNFVDAAAPAPPPAPIQAGGPMAGGLGATIAEGMTNAL